jgi:peroxiredoxin Q/BCP
MILILVLVAIISFFSFYFFTYSFDVDPLAAGAPAPSVTGTDQDGTPVNFADIYAKGITLVYFYPKADTPGCTAEACSLRDSYTTLHGKNVEIIGVSRDTARAQKKFQAKYKLPFVLIADTDGKIAEAFGVPSLLGKFSSRESFLIKDGKVAKTFVKVNAAGHAREVQQAIDNLK